MSKDIPFLILRADATPEIGVGHAVRQLALAEELHRRGFPVILVGELSVAWVRNLWDEALVPVYSATTDLVGLAPDVVVIDGYHLDPALGAALRAAGVPVVAFVDGDFGLGQVADLYVDQNLGAVPVSGRAMLAGIEYALLRDSVLAARRQYFILNRTPRVLVVFGGTDAFDGCVTLARAVLDCGRPVAVLAVAATTEIARRLAELPVPSGCELVVYEPVADLPALAASCDAVVTAAGTSVWEFLCLGLPVGLVWVTENQRIGYDITVSEDVVCGFGYLADIKDRPEIAEAATRELLDDRERLRYVGPQLVDGCGKQRVADAVLRLVGV